MRDEQSTGLAPASVREHVVRAIADARDAAPHQLDPPLYEAVDPDALETLFEESRRPRFRFGYDGQPVVVRRDRSVLVGGTVYEYPDATQ